MQRAKNQHVPTKLFFRLKTQKMKNVVNKEDVDLLNIKHHPQSSRKVNPLPTLSFKGEITNRQHWNTLPREVVESKNAWIWSMRIWFSGEHGGGWGQNLVTLEVFSKHNNSVMKNDIVSYILLSIPIKYFTVTPHLPVYQNSTVILPQIQLCHVQKRANPLCFWQDLVPFQLFFPQGSELGSVPSTVQWIHKWH